MRLNENVNSDIHLLLNGHTGIIAFLNLWDKAMLKGWRSCNLFTHICAQKYNFVHFQVVSSNYLLSNVTC